MNVPEVGINELHSYSFGRRGGQRTLIIGADRSRGRLRRWVFLAGVGAVAIGVGVYTGRQQDGSTQQVAVSGPAAATAPLPAAGPATAPEPAAIALSANRQTTQREPARPGFRAAPDSVLAAVARAIPLLAPASATGSAPQSLAASAPLAAALVPAALPEPATIVAAVPEPATDEADAEAPVMQLPPTRDAEADEPSIPLPTPRPVELRTARGADPVRPPPAIVPRQVAKAAPAVPAAAAEPSFFSKIFGVQKPEGQVLAYASPQDDAVDPLRGRPSVAAVAPSSGGGVAVYDIAARTVTMPNGERLEAHSGLGSMLDDPRYVSERMRGPTPPHTYDLSLREALFHGVQAIRLNPIGGAGAIHGRAGLLAHTFMLGPKGDSNGCVSFRDYEKFLQAYLRGEVKRLVVVAGRG